MSFPRLKSRFPDELKARKYLEKRRWKNGIICPHCGSMSINSRKGSGAGRHACRGCKKNFTVRTGSALDHTKIPLYYWIYAIYIVMSANDDISVAKLAEKINVNRRTSRLLLMRIQGVSGGDFMKLKEIQQSAKGRKLDKGVELLFSLPSKYPHKLINGDTLNREVVPRESVDLIVTSPPYNVGMAYSGDGSDDRLDYNDYLDFSRKWIANCYYWTRDTGRLCINVGLDKSKDGKNPVCADITRIAMECGWNYHATVIWNEGNISRRTAWGSWKSASAPHVIAPVEVVIILHKGDWKRLRQGENDITADEFKDWVLGIWDFGGESAKRIGHEAPFPRELPKRCIKLFSFLGDTVLDPFVGSGTSMIEAINNGRHAYGIEREKQYCELTLERIKRECALKLKKFSPRGGGAGSTAPYWSA